MNHAVMISWVGVVAGGPRHPCRLYPAELNIFWIIRKTMIIPSCITLISGEKPFLNFERLR